MNTKPENTDSPNGEVEEVIVVEPLKDDATQEEKDEYYENLEKSNKQLFARAKKAEGFVLKDGKWVKPEKPAEKKETPAQATTETSKDNLNQADLITLIKADVPEEDIPEVLDYAKLKGISVREALQSPVVKNILSVNKEMRATAAGTHTGGGSRGKGKVSDETLIENANKGIMPESEADMARLVELRRK